MKSEQQDMMKEHATAVNDAVKEVMKDTPHKLFAEMLGTFCLVFTVALVSYNKALNPYSSSTFAVGSMLMVLIYALAHVSGAHFNPAVTVAVFLQRKISFKEAAAYCVAQVIGGLGASFLAGFLLDFNVPKVVSITDKFYFFQPMLVELLYTMMLCFVVLNVAFCPSSKAMENNKFYGLAIGLVVVAGGLGGGVVSGGCFNPAVALAMDMASVGNGIPFASLVYIAVEMVGAALSVVLFHIVRPAEKHDEGLGEYSPSKIAHKIEGYCPPKLSAEFIGTFFLTLTIGLNGLAAQNKLQDASQSAMAIGAALTSMIYAVGDVSGAHFNPAVTLSILLTGRDLIEPHHNKQVALEYVLAQVAGGAAAAMTYHSIFLDQSVSAFAIGPSTSGLLIPAIVCEVFATFVLCYVVLCVVTVNESLREFFGLAIGACIWAVGEAAGPISGGRMNPAVSVGATVSCFGWMEFNWLFWVIAEMLGGALAAVVFLKGTHTPNSGAPSNDLGRPLL